MTFCFEKVGNTSGMSWAFAWSPVLKYNSNPNENFDEINVFRFQFDSTYDFSSYMIDEGKLLIIGLSFLRCLWTLLQPKLVT